MTHLTNSLYNDINLVLHTELCSWQIHATVTGAPATRSASCWTTNANPCAAARPTVRRSTRQSAAPTERPTVTSALWESRRAKQRRTCEFCSEEHVPKVSPTQSLEYPQARISNVPEWFVPYYENMWNKMWKFWLFALWNLPIVFNESHFNFEAIWAENIYTTKLYCILQPSKSYVRLCTGCDIRPLVVASACELGTLCD